MGESEPGIIRSLLHGGWRAVSEWPEAERPPAPWVWLGYSGSLTQKLRALAGDTFHVRVVRETSTELQAEDARLLGVASGSPALLREVYLCGTKPLVFGRTLAPTQGAARWLEQLGAQPLGDRVFAGQDTVRGEIEVQQLGGFDPFYRDAVRELDKAPARLWVRRSVLNVQAARLLIYEAFLPGVAD